MKKYRLFKEKEFDILYRIVSLKNFNNVKKGDIGGWVESEANLSHYSNCWVYNKAKVSGNAKVSEYKTYKYGTIICNTNNNNIIEQEIFFTFGIFPIKNKIILYKHVYKSKIKNTYISLHDKNYFYYLNKNNIVDDKLLLRDKNKDIKSCSSGLHVTSGQFLIKFLSGDCVIAVEIDIRDIITIQQYKLRCKKLKVLGEVKSNE